MARRSECLNASPRRPLRPKPLLHLVPNIFTILGLCLGLTGLRYAIDGRFELAVTFVLLSGVIDGLDGAFGKAFEHD